MLYLSQKQKENI